MRIPRSAYLLLLTAFVAVPAAAAEPGAPKKRVAVLEFQGAIPAETLQVITDSARVGALDVANALGLMVMTRESMAAVLKDMGRSSGQCTEGECEVETGRLIGADLVITGMVSRIEARYVVTVKTHETKGGALLGSEQVDTADQFQLLASVKEATRRCLEPRGTAAAANVVFSTAAGSDAPATVAAAIDAGYEARRFAICSTVDTGSWTFCRGGKQPVTENAFARDYRQMTGLRDVRTRRANWNQVGLYTGAFVALAGGSLWAYKKSVDKDREAREMRDRGEYVGTSELEDQSESYAMIAALGGVGAGTAGLMAAIAWMTPGDPPATDHGLSLPAARGAVERYNSALKEQLRHELGPRSEAPRRQDSAVRVRPYLSPLGAGIAGVF